MLSVIQIIIIQYVNSYIYMTFNEEDELKVQVLFFPFKIIKKYYI